MKGELVRQIKYDYGNSPRTINDIQWDGREFSGKKVVNGFYVYRVTVASREDGAKFQQYEKLVIIN